MPSSHRVKKARQVKSNVKTMLICFFNAKRIVHSEFVPKGQSVTQVFYLEVVKRLRNSVRRKRPKMWQSDDWFFHHDNAPANTAVSFLWKETACLSRPTHPIYSTWL
uniref:Mariner Mos1 transposase n=1 Tax=Photinus pyralis TaxID=7054 RepID=A0A1Y1M6W7_PHOPY